jgi:hypothetical protein
MKKDEAIEYISRMQGFVPYYTIISLYDDDAEIPQELIDLCVYKIRESNMRIINPELSKIINGEE